MDEQRKCPNCGEPVSDTDTVCPSCGESLVGG
jgi:rubrerythrin